ncbi:MAG: hypothetical protein QUS35_04690, partial [bacterium]|nr:hypothetical protein [bacterium]
TFIRDVNLFAAADAAALSGSPNFRPGTDPIKPLFMMIGADAAFSEGIRTVDAEVYFSRREASSRFFRSGGYNIRVRDENRFESIEFGLSKDYLFRRIHPRFLLRGKSLVLLGVNRWMNLASSPRHFADAFLFDCSLSQSVFFDALDRRSVVLGAGVQENLDYLWSRDWRFRVAVLFHAGVKL